MRSFWEVRRQEGSKSFRQVGSVQLRSPQAMQATFVEKSSQRGFLSKVTLFQSMLEDLFGLVTPGIKGKSEKVQLLVKAEGEMQIQRMWLCLRLRLWLTTWPLHWVRTRNWVGEGAWLDRGCSSQRSSASELVSQTRSWWAPRAGWLWIVKGSTQLWRSHISHPLS